MRGQADLSRRQPTPCRPCCRCRDRAAAPASGRCGPGRAGRCRWACPAPATGTPRLRWPRCRWRPGIRAAARTGHGRIDHAYALLQAGRDIGQRLPVGIVEMHRQRRHRHGLRHCGQHPTRLDRRAHANGVAQRDFIAAERVQTLRHIHHVGHRHLALVRAAQHGGDVAAHAYPIERGLLQDWPKPFDRFVDAGVGIGAIERLRCCGEYRHFLRPAARARS